MRDKRTKDKHENIKSLLRPGIGKRCHNCRAKMEALPYGVFFTDVFNEEITQLYHCSKNCYDFTDKTRTHEDQIFTPPEFWRLRTLLKQKRIGELREQLADLFGTWFVPREVIKEYKRALYYARLEADRQPANKSDVR